MKKIPKFEIRMMKFNKYAYLITSLLFFVFFIINKQESFAMGSIFFIQPTFSFSVMELFNGIKIFRPYFLHRAQRTNKNGKDVILKNELFALMTIFIQAFFFRNLTWYNVIIVIVLGMVFEYLRDLVKVVECKDN